MKVKCMETRMGLQAGMIYEIDSELENEYEIFGFYYPKSMFSQLSELFDGFRRIFSNVL